jgi:hypothetical protein
VNVRTLTDADAETVATVVVADSEALTGRPSLLGPRDVREWWSRVDLSHVSLDVDVDSPIGASKLYESVGMHVESAMIVYER